MKTVETLGWIIVLENSNQHMSKTWSDSLHAQVTAGWTATSWALVLPAVPLVDGCCLVCAAYRSSLSANHIPPQDIFRCIFLRPSTPQGHFWGLSSSPSAFTVLSAIRWQEIRSTPQTCQRAPWFRACAGPCSYLRKEDEDRDVWDGREIHHLLRD